MHSLRLENESDESFRKRAHRASLCARVLSEACLANSCMQGYIADPALPHITLDRVRTNPTVRIEYEQAVAFGAIGETLNATRNKHWGDGPWVMQLEPSDWFYAERITYLFRENSLYNRRFQQRQRMKELLGKPYRCLVEKAKYKRNAQKLFLRDLSTDQARAIERILHVDPVTFWRMCKGKAFVALRPRENQLLLPFEDSEPDGPSANVET